MVVMVLAKILSHSDLVLFFTGCSRESRPNWPDIITKGNDFRQGRYVFEIPIAIADAS